MAYVRGLRSSILTAGREGDEWKGVPGRYSSPALEPSKTLAPLAQLSPSGKKGGVNGRKAWPLTVVSHLGWQRVDQAMVRGLAQKRIAVCCPRSVSSLVINDCISILKSKASVNQKLKCVLISLNPNLPCAYPFSKAPFI